MDWPQSSKSPPRIPFMLAQTLSFFRPFFMWIEGMSRRKRISSGSEPFPARICPIFDDRILCSSKIFCSSVSSDVSTLNDASSTATTTLLLLLLMLNEKLKSISKKKIKQQQFSKRNFDILDKNKRITFLKL